MKDAYTHSKTKRSALINVFLVALMMITAINLHAQSVGINTDGSAPNSKAILDLKSSTMGLLIPRMTKSQRGGFASTLTATEKGMLIYDTDQNHCYFWDGTEFVKIKTGVFTILQDLDSDTKIQVEENADEDIIRFDVAGTERWVMDTTRLEPKNSGRSVFIGESAGKSDDLTHNRNIAIGTGALQNNAMGWSLVAIGDSAMYNNGLGAIDTTDGILNTAVGSWALFSNTVGVGNTAIGYKSIYQNTTGTSNTALGTSSLRKNTTGSVNTAVGNSALFYNTTGEGNVALGRWSLHDNRTGNTNTALGYKALKSDTSGTGNVAVGAFSLYHNVNRGHLVAIGDSALFNNGLDASEPSHSTDNTAVGSKSLASNTIGHNNTALGRKSLTKNTTGLLNTAVGANALLSNTTGHRNTALGNAALVSHVSGDYNTAVGNGALFFHKSGDKNTAIGTYAMLESKSGEGNTAIGFNTLQSDTSGSSNVAIGSHALYYNSDRSNLVAIGDSALFHNANSEVTLYYHGAANTAVGSKAMFNNTTGYYNTALGFQSMYDNISGQHNSAVGRESLYANTGNQNTAMGYRSLYNKEAGIANTALGAFAQYNLESGHYNTVVGTYADYFNTGGEKNTIIGYQAGNNSAYHGKDGSVFIGYQAGYHESGDNKLYIENTSSTDPLIYGDFSADAVGILGKLGIGTKTPGFDLDIEGTTPTISLNDLQIADLGTGNLGIDGDIIPYFSVSFDLGNNAVGEHWDQVWAISFNTYSDVNTKQNIKAIPYGLDEILALNPVSFEYKEEIATDDKVHLGLIAQEVLPVMPSIVITDDVDVDPETGKLITTQGEYMGMSYMELIPVLIKGIQELAEQVVNQNDELEAIRIENERIKKQLSVLMQNSNINSN